MKKTPRSLVILGSARSNGNTRQVVDRLTELHNCDLIDLNDWQFSYYDYEHKNRDDDFIKIIDRVLNYDILIFASPIYWYSMSAVMKTFFDRISDLLKIRKEKGRQLRGKTMLVISCNGDSEDYPSFAAPFEHSADYLGMQYAGYCHAWMEGNQISTETEAKLAQLAADLSALEDQMRLS
ncbi:MAG: NAD(P)H-dependent oxidoreductase [Saprospiraceae bacterium]|nr:NAD(P)H-dependent oxidoreductase [Saprospiraceae bacterium]